MTSYKDQIKCKQLAEFMNTEPYGLTQDQMDELYVQATHSHRQTPKETARTEAMSDCKADRQDEVKQMENDVNWDEALASAGFITLEPEKRKVLVCKNWKLEKVNKFGEEKIEFSADVIEEDEAEVEKKFTTVSKRLLKKLRPLFDGKPVEEEVRFSVKTVGKSFETQYDVEAL